MAFSVNEVVRVARLSRSRFVYAPGAYKTNQPLDWQATRTTSLTLKAMQEEKTSARSVATFPQHGTNFLLVENSQRASAWSFDNSIDFLLTISINNQKVIRIITMITKRKMLWSFVKFSQRILQGNVLFGEFVSGFRGLKGLTLANIF